MCLYGKILYAIELIRHTILVYVDHCMMVLTCSSKGYSSLGTWWIKIWSSPGIRWKFDQVLGMLGWMKFDQILGVDDVLIKS